MKIAGKRYVLVNIPAAQVEAIENNTVVSRHSGVVGKPDRPTPHAALHHHRPELQSGLDIAADRDQGGPDPEGSGHAAEAGRSVLVKFGIDAYEGGKKIASEKIDWSSAKPLQLSYRQAPGKENPLGFLKINFPNASSVYMHDSPERVALWAQFPSGQLGLCARAEHRGARRLAAEGQPGGPKSKSRP